MTDHYEMPHARADECPHAGVGKACRPCRDRFERAPLTPDERAAMRRLALTTPQTPGEHAYVEHVPRLLDALDTAEAERDEARAAIARRRALWEHERATWSAALTLDRRDRDEARAEVARLREEAARPAPAWDEDTVRAEVDCEALRRFVDSFCGDEAGEVEHVMSADGTSGFAFTGGNDAHAVLRKAASALWPGESRATVQAEALRDAADAAVAQDNTQGDWWDEDRQTYGTPVDWLRARADRLEKGADRG